MSSKTSTINFHRLEMVWLYRQIKTASDKAQAIINNYSGPVKDGWTGPEKAALHEAQEHGDQLLALSQSIKDILVAGDKNRLMLRDQEAALNEAFGLVEEDSAKHEIMARLKALPKEEPYRVKFDRGTIKFTLKLVESDLQKFRASVIPTYEKADPSEFKDPIETKSYYVNKARAAKDTLEKLKEKLEREL